MHIKEQLHLIRAENDGCKILVFKDFGWHVKDEGIWDFINCKYKIDLKKIEDAEWPDDDAYDVMRVNNGKLIIHCEPKEGCYQYPETIIKHFYEDTDEVRTREPLKNIDDIDWTKSPPWATCAAVDKKGCAFWFKNSMAEPDSEESWYRCGKWELIGYGFDASDWKNSKRMRPVKKRLITAIELWGKALKVKGDNDVYILVDQISTKSNEVYANDICRSIEEIIEICDGWCDHPSEELKSFEVEE